MPIGSPSCPWDDGLPAATKEEGPPYGEPSSFDRISMNQPRLDISVLRLVCESDRRIKLQLYRRAGLDDNVLALAEQ